MLKTLLHQKRHKKEMRRREIRIARRAGRECLKRAARNRDYEAVQNLREQERERQLAEQRKQAAAVRTAQKRSAIPKGSGFIGKIRSFFGGRGS